MSGYVIVREAGPAVSIVDGTPLVTIVETGRQGPPPTAAQIVGALDGAIATANLSDVTSTAPTSGQTLISDGTNYAPGQVGAAGLASNAVTTAKVADLNITTGKLANGAVTSAKIDATVATAASVTSEAATRAAAVTSLDLLKDDRIQGRRFGSPALTGWELAKAIGAFFPARVVFIRDSHGELGVDTEFNRIAARSRQQRVPLLGQSGHWVPAKATGFGALTHSGAVDASSGPGGWGATLSAGSWIQWGDGTNQDVTGWRFFGVGTFTIDSRTAGGSTLESTTVTLAAGESWTSTSSTTYGFRQLRVTGSGAGGVAWGAFMALDNLSTGYQPWSFSHSGWAGDDILANTATWTMVDTLDPALVVIGMATNETDATAYRTNTEALIARARLTDADRSIALWFPHLASASGDDETWWDDAHTAFREMCVEHNCCPIDLYALWGDLSTSDPYGLIDTSDYVHLSALGNALASLIQASVLLDDAPGVRPVDATGVQPADTISFRNVSPGYSNVTLYAGNASSPGDYVTVARGGTWIPVAAGTPTIGQHLTTRAYVEGAFQPLDSDLTAIAALSTTSYGRSLLALADAAAGRTALGLGSLATASVITSSNITDGTIVNADISGSAAIDGTKVNYATTDAQGVVELATTAETQTGSAADRAVTPAGLAATTATETRAGVVELATTAEATTGTDTARAVTPAGVDAYVDAVLAGNVTIGGDLLVDDDTLTVQIAQAKVTLELDTDGSAAVNSYVGSEAQPRLTIGYLGAIGLPVLTFGPGGAAVPDTTFYRSGVGALVLVGTLEVSDATTATMALNRRTADARYVPNMFIDSFAWGAVTGSPARSSYGSALGVALLYDAAAVEKAVTIIDVPPSWATFRIDAWWTNSGAGSGNVVWATEARWIGDTDDLDTVSSDTATVTVAAPSQDVTKVTTLDSSVTRTAGKRLVLHVQRTGTSGSDTLANDAGLIGIDLVRLT